MTTKNDDFMQCENKKCPLIEEGSKCYGFDAEIGSKKCVVCGCHRSLHYRPPVEESTQGHAASAASGSYSSLCAPPLKYIKEERREAFKSAVPVSRPPVTNKSSSSTTNITKNSTGSASNITAKGSSLTTVPRVLVHKFVSTIAISPVTEFSFAQPHQDHALLDDVDLADGDLLLNLVRDSSVRGHFREGKFFIYFLEGQKRWTPTGLSHRTANNNATAKATAAHVISVLAQTKNTRLIVMPHLFDHDYEVFKEPITVDLSDEPDDQTYPQKRSKYESGPKIKVEENADDETDEAAAQMPLSRMAELAGGTHRPNTTSGHSHSSDSELASGEYRPNTTSGQGHASESTDPLAYQDTELQAVYASDATTANATNTTPSTSSASNMHANDITSSANQYAIAGSSATPPSTSATSASVAPSRYPHRGNRGKGRGQGNTQY